MAQIKGPLNHLIDSIVWETLPSDLYRGMTLHGLLFPAPYLDLPSQNPEDVPLVAGPSLYVDHSDGCVHHGRYYGRNRHTGGY